MENNIDRVRIAELRRFRTAMRELQSWVGQVERAAEGTEADWLNVCTALRALTSSVPMPGPWLPWLKQKKSDRQTLISFQLSVDQM